MSQMYMRLHVKYPLSCQILMNLKLPRQIFRKKKTRKYQISCKSVQWEKSSSMRTERGTGRHDEADSRFSQFPNAPNKEKSY